MTENEGPSFHLRKWYLDCVTEDGAAFIGYAARLRWGLLRLRYSATLLSIPGAPPRERRTFLRPTFPDAAPNRVDWACPALRVAGRWDATSAPIRSTLYSAEDGSIDWHCRIPSARARVRLGGRTIEGSGYVEELVTTIAPWQMPLDTLFWGRFHDDEGAAVWIRWEGSRPLSEAHLDGATVALTRVGPDRVELGDANVIAFDGTRTIRAGPVVSGPLRGIPFLTRHMPESFLDAAEEKWLSTATLEAPGSSPRSGWAIHERVRFH